MATCSASELLEAGKCFQCLTEKQLYIAIAQLLCDVKAGGEVVPCENLEGEDSPLDSITPAFIGQVYIQDDGTIWQAGSLLSSSWTEICTPGGGGNGLTWGPDATDLAKFEWSDGTLDDGNGTITSLTFNGLVSQSDPNSALSISDSEFIELLSLPVLATVAGSFNGYGSQALTSVSAPVLETVDIDIDFDGCPVLPDFSLPALTTVDGSINLYSCDLLESVSFPNLTSVGSGLSFYDCPIIADVDLSSLVSTPDISGSSCVSFVTLNLPALVSCDSFVFYDCTALANVSFPNLVLNDGAFLYFNDLGGGGCSLSAASVNHILARGVASPAFVSGLVDLSGGTSAAPTGQGILDKATLIGRGVTVNTN